MRGLIGLLGLVAIGAVARSTLDVVEVRGRSMAPTLLPGDRLLVARSSAARRDDVVLAADPRHPARELVKRVADVRDGRILLRGDNPAASTDGRTFGSIPAGDVRWRAVLRYWPPSRAGRIPGPPPAAFASTEEGGEPACAFPEALVAGG
jgi:nickel-type superoxide dismutase maturation protease